MEQISNKNKESIVKPKKISRKRKIFGALFVLFSVVMVFSFTSYLLKWKEDQSQAGEFLDREIRSSNLFGKVGDWLGNMFVFSSLGVSAYVVALMSFVLGASILKLKWPKFKFWKIMGHCIFFICWLPVFVGTITQGDGVLSGVYGFQMMDYMTLLIGKFGLWLVVFGSIVLYFVLEFDLRPSAVMAKWNTMGEKIKNSMPDFKQMLAEEDEEEEEFEKKSQKNTDSENKIEMISLFSEEGKDDIQKEKSQEKIEIQEKTSIELPVESSPSLSLNETQELNEKNQISGEKEKNQTPEKQNFTDLIIEKNTPEIPADEKSSSQDQISFEIEVPQSSPVQEEDNSLYQKILQEQGEYDHRLELAHYKMPSLDLLKDYGQNEEISINTEELEENKNNIIAVLKNFNVAISQIKATIGPTVTLYEIIPEAGVRISQIKRLQDDIALSLSALGIRIIAPMPGKGTVGIEVPRKNTSMVSMRSVIGSQKFQNTEMDLPVVFGRTISNEIFMADLAKMPHLLMAGATGQGKSVGINAILTSLLYKKHPSELKFVMVDPKKVELSLYSKIERHYLAKLPDAEDAIITDNHKVVNTLNSLCIEMDTRYELLKNAYCKNIKEYNKKFSERRLNPEQGHRYLPYIVLVVDEFADLIMTAGKEVEHPIARLAQLARAVGIHLIVATQRPSVNVITGMIKANFPARAAFRVMTGIDSKTILDTPGAEQLVGKGDMLYLNGSEVIRLQCAFVDTPEVERIASFIGEQRGFASAFLLPEYAGEESANAGTFDPNEKDVMFEEAARIVVSTQQGSTSMLQRQLKLGYNRAGRIMDQLEASGIVGGFNGAKAREVLISDIHYLEEFLEQLKKS